MSREFVTGLPSLFSSTMCRNSWFGISFTKIHFTLNFPMNYTKTKNGVQVFVLIMTLRLYFGKLVTLSYTASIVGSSLSFNYSLT